MIILINGPPRSGKDTVAKLIKQYLPLTEDYKMSKPLKLAFRALLNVQDKMAHILLETHKDEPLFHDSPITTRDVLISLSEDTLKPLFGSDILGVLAVAHMKSIATHHITISDCGFADEIKPIQDKYGYTQVVAIQISRDGCNYNTDSRSDIDFDTLGIQWVSLKNNMDKDEMLPAQVRRILRKWELIDD